MPQTVIENPILNSAFAEPGRHFRFDAQGITDEIAVGRRVSEYFVPIPAPRARGKGRQITMDFEQAAERREENKQINQIRARVALWRGRGYPDLTRTSRMLLAYWQNPERARRLFFCQIEALETAIYLAEAARKSGDAWIENFLREQSAEYNPGLYRVAFKMATGSGKTVVMAMLIAWQTLNKGANPQDARFADAFLIVTPGVTIRDRLRVLLPNDPQNYFRALDIVPADMREDLGQAKIVITNRHAFGLRDLSDAAKLTKTILARGQANPFVETPDQMARRVCRELGNKRNIVVINDEAHHCYHHRAGAEALTGDERREAEERERAADMWISGLDAVGAKLGIRTVYDLSATPFFLRGSGYPEGFLFPWVVSDFSLIDAIESGIVKIPRVPVADNAMTGEGPVYRELWLRIRDDLPKKGRGANGEGGAVPRLPMVLQGALESLYGNYRQYYAAWEANTAARDQGLTPPVFIVVCNNTAVSKLVFDYIAGWDKGLPDGTTVPVPGRLDLFSNVEDGRWTARPRTILVDSEQLESGEGMSGEFKRIAAREIEEFKAEYRARFPGRDAETLTDEDILREVMNTVGKAGKLGEGVRCVVSVSMLTEGWDANTVTHILGVRAFGTQLLCEQVVGRALRRMSYAPDPDGMFAPEYAEVYGVPFSFIPAAGSPKTPKPGPLPVRVRALAERSACEITFPRLTGYRYEFPTERISAHFTQDSYMPLSTLDIPTSTDNAPIVGEISIHTLYGLREQREQQVAFEIARAVLDRYCADEAGNVRPWLFPQVLDITKRWLVHYLICKDNTFPQMLLIAQLTARAADRIGRALAPTAAGDATLRPILRAHDTVGSTRYCDFDTTRPVYATDATKCQINYMVADSGWEMKLAEVLESLPEVLSYAKNQGLGFVIPYTLDGEDRAYFPDFLIRCDDGAGPNDPLTLILEVSGEARLDKAAKVATARSLWVPAINHHAAFGRWAFLEITDPWDAAHTIRATLQRSNVGTLGGVISA